MLLTDACDFVDHAAACDFVVELMQLFVFERAVAKNFQVAV